MTHDILFVILVLTLSVHRIHLSCLFFEHPHECINICEKCVPIVEGGRLCENTVVEEPHTQLVAVGLPTHKLKLQQHLDQALELNDHVYIG